MVLRVLEHGYKVKMVRTEFVSYAVDTAEDLSNVEDNEIKIVSALKVGGMDQVLIWDDHPPPEDYKSSLIVL